MIYNINAMDLQEISKSEDVKFLDEVTSIRKAAKELKGILPKFLCTLSNDIFRFQIRF